MAWESEWTNSTKKFEECIWQTERNCDIKLPDIYKIDLFASRLPVLFFCGYFTTTQHNIAFRLLCVLLPFLLRHNTNKFDCLTRLVSFSCMFVVHFLYMQRLLSIFSCKQQRLFLLSIWFIVFVSNQLLLNPFWFNFTWRTSSISTCVWKSQLHK